MTRRWITVAAVMLTAWGATIGAAEARDPTPLPADYPSIGPSTTTTTIPIETNYPTTAPTTTAPPVTTTTVAPAPTTTASPPTTAAPRPVPTTTLPDLEPEPDPENDVNPALTDEPTLAGDIVYYETATEHALTILDIGVDGAVAYRQFAGPDDVIVTTTGILQWRPGEEHGGRTAVIGIIAEAADGSQARIDVNMLVAETNTMPEVIAPPIVRGFPGKTTEAVFSVADPDTPEDAHTWSVAGPASVTIDDAGVLRWTVADDAEPGRVEITVTATDDGEPAKSGSLTLRVEIVDTSEAAVMAVDAEGAPVNPMVIGADETAAAPAVMVDLDEPAQLLTAVAARTPRPAASPRVDAGRVEKVTGVIQQSAVIQSAQETLGALLDLEVPTTAVAGGLAWQLALLIAPSTFGRTRRVYDIVGVAPGAEIGNDRFRFRGDARGLEAGPIRRRGGRWMRAVESPFGDIWIPAANLRAVPRDTERTLEARLAH